MKPRNLHTESYRGFTLVEVLISVAIIGMVMVLLYSSFVSTLSAPDEFGSVQERYIAIGRAMNRMAKEIEMAFISAHYNPRYEKSPKTIFKLQDNRLDFTAFAHLKIVKDANESDQCEISYFLKEGENGKQNLVRREQKRIDDDPEHGGYIYTLLDDVLELKIEAWNGEDWVEEWDSTKVEYFNRLPERIRIWITVFDENGERRTFVTETKPRLLRVLKF